MLLKELTQLNEASNVGEILEKYLDHKKFYNFEGPRGVRNLTEVVKALDSNYRSLEDFLEDNSGAIEALLAWISKANVLEWTVNLKEEIPGLEDEEDE